MAYLRNLWTNMLDIFFPSLCLGCRSNLKNGEAYLCRSCHSKISINNAFHCSKCDKRLPAKGGHIKKCPCKDSFIVGLAVNYKSMPAQELIKGLKYYGIKGAASELSNFLVRYLKNTGLNHKNFHILPVPLYEQRMRERGFNQSELIADNVRKLLNLPSEAVIKDALFRVKATGQQARMADYKERFKNVAGCFSVRNRQKIKGGRILLIDDVFTSGATSGEAVKALKEAGVAKVIVLCVAKA